MGILLFFPFIGVMVKWLQKIFPEKFHKITKYIHEISPDLSEAAEVAVRNETIYVFQKTLRLISFLLRANKNEEVEIFISKKKENFASVFEDIQKLNKEILVFSSHIKVDQLEDTQKERSSNIKYIVMVLSQVSKTIAGIIQEVEEVNNSSNKKVQEIVLHLNSKINEDITILFGMLDKEEFPETIEMFQDKINSDYKNIVDLISRSIEEKKIEEKHISTLFMVNGLLSQSIRHLLRAVEKIN